MGCDIHFHSEVKINGTWHHHSSSRLKRNYYLFAKMANVRNNIPIRPISLPKGWPDDVTYLTKLESEQYGVDGHSHSWLNAREIVELHKFISDHPEYFGEFWDHHHLPYFMGNHFNDFVEYPEDWEKYGVEDVRYVFFFDN